MALARSLFELYNHRQSDPAWLDKRVAAFAADAEVIDGPSGAPLHGPEGYKRLMLFFVEHFPDCRTELTDVFATEDRVVVESISRGTTTGSRTLPPGALKASGRPGEVRMCQVLQFRHGKIVSLHGYSDSTTLLDQFGLNAATAQAM